jgi:membrane glycosyltransferase
MITTSSPQLLVTKCIGSLAASAVTPALRRTLFFGLVLLTTCVGTNMMLEILQANGLTDIEMAILVLFAVTFGWITIALWTAMIGFVLQLLRRDPLSLRRCPPWEHVEASPLTTRTAIVMPVYNENPAQVLAGLEATFRSVQRTGSLASFDFFLLSDTTDPLIATAEERGWAALCRRLGAEGKIFYRRRERNVSRKAGNIADFCCRWGGHYDFMIVLDADSIMSGEAICALARAMQATPRAGIIQTVPIPVGQQTMFGRFVRFASRLYSPMLATGLSFWQLGEANYWGHNAIIRIAPFMQHCGLPVLPGQPPLGGEIHSHDFVEAALIRRGGWHVYLLPYITGSYEDVPGNLFDFAKRDRRWAQGNLQHLKLLLVRGLHPLSRLHFLLGALAYVSSLLWLVLLGLSTSDALGRALWPHDFFGPSYQLFPDWPIAKTDEIVSLLVVTVALLFLPKLAGLLLCLRDRHQREAFGGAGRVLTSALVESLFAVLIAPVMMLLHAHFVVSILCGHAVSWNPQTREGRSIGFHETARYLLIPTLIGVVWGAVTFYLAPPFFWWLTPVLLGLGLAIPLIMWSSRSSVGQRLRQLGLFCTPEELAPPIELQDAYRASKALEKELHSAASSLPLAAPPESWGEMQPQSIEPAFSWSQKERWGMSGASSKAR